MALFSILSSAHDVPLGCNQGLKTRRSGRALLGVWTFYVLFSPQAEETW